MLKKNLSVRPAAWRERYIAAMRRADALAVAGALALTQLVRFGSGQDRLELGPVPVPYWAVGLVLAAAWWAFLELRGARDVRLIGYGTEEYRQVVSTTLVLFGGLAIASYALGIPMARGYIVAALPTGLVLLLAGRSLVRHRLIRARRAGTAMTRTLVVGRVPGVVEMVRSLQEHPESGFAPVAVYAPSSSFVLPASLAGVDVPPNLLPAGGRPGVEDIVAACREHRIETLVLAASAPLSSEEVRHLSWYLADEHVRLVLDTGLTDVAGPRIHTQHLAGLPLIHVSTPRLSRSRLLLKRAVDVVGAATALLLLAPVMAVLALIVKRHDGGPALFAQERTGLDGRPFRMLKFRSMYPDAEERKAALMARNDAKGGVLFFMEDDPRVTGPGKWMRKYSLDELPQFLNVLKGEMSLVGPRPPLPSEVAQYEAHVHRRLRVKPGITGLWQVSGRDDLDWDQAVRLDLYYVENWSPVQDLVILARTVRAVVAKEGAH
ncbi:polyprenyl glycosylphosphotransferase [Kocuria flava]|uniref:Polyprenyl glycosylphosphotransferase n=1 Tax=Kocuria flava TaxID=446860 RepID=A0A2N4T4R7_9MICC|nr:sugar transferase [Kocuria flava]PLC13214.1 polyprenyl glycosylphosphotransferase [Kocuria flava]